MGRETIIRVLELGEWIMGDPHSPRLKERRPAHHCGHHHRRTLLHRHSRSGMSSFPRMQPIRWRHVAAPSAARAQCRAELSSAMRPWEQQAYSFSPRVSGQPSDRCQVATLCGL